MPARRRSHRANRNTPSYSPRRQSRAPPSTSSSPGRRLQAPARAREPASALKRLRLSDLPVAAGGELTAPLAFAASSSMHDASPCFLRWNLAINRRLMSSTSAGSSVTTWGKDLRQSRVGGCVLRFQRLERRPRALHWRLPARSSSQHLFSPVRDVLEQVTGVSTRPGDACRHVPPPSDIHAAARRSSAAPAHGNDVASVRSLLAVIPSRGDEVDHVSPVGATDSTRSPTTPSRGGPSRG